jgi:glutathione S-transferase
MALKITGIPQSVCTIRVLEVLAEKGVTDFELYKPNMAAKEHKVSIDASSDVYPRTNCDPNFQAKAHTDKQPFGVIPVLEDGDFTLYGTMLGLANFLSHQL